MFGERIRTLRKEKGMTLRDLSIELGIPFTTLGNYEREDRQPNFETLENIANFFNVSIDYLAGRREERTFTEYVFNNDVTKLADVLKNVTPENRKLVVDIIDQLYMITYVDLKQEKENPRELELIYEIVNFILRMKNGFVWSKFRDDFPDSSSSYEVVSDYLNEKNALDKILNELFEIYSAKYFDKFK